MNKTANKTGVCVCIVVNYTSLRYVQGELRSLLTTKLQVRQNKQKLLLIKAKKVKL
jgi:hypothetical protein